MGNYVNNLSYWKTLKNTCKDSYIAADQQIKYLFGKKKEKRKKKNKQKNNQSINQTNKTTQNPQKITKQTKKKTPKPNKNNAQVLIS